MRGYLAARRAARAIIWCRGVGAPRRLADGAAGGERFRKGDLPFGHELRLRRALVLGIEIGVEDDRMGGHVSHAVAHERRLEGSARSGVWSRSRRRRWRAEPAAKQTSFMVHLWIGIREPDYLYR